MSLCKLVPFISPAVLLLCFGLVLAQDAKNDQIDWNKARAIRQKMLDGETLTGDERAYMERAREAIQSGQQPRPNAGAIKVPEGLKPLGDMTAEDRYKGQEGGLYGEGKNFPPEKLLQAALQQAKLIQPLDSSGKPSAEGKIVLISLGMSNTTQEFSQFVKLANRDAAKSPQVMIVDGAQGGMAANIWANPERTPRPNAPNPWRVLDERLKSSGVAAEQVQAVWIKQAIPQPVSLGEFPKHAEELKRHLVVILQKLKERFPNLRMAYLSSRIYAGYATTGLNPEPYAYESAFSVRWLIQDQMKGEAGLNFDADKGAVKSPVLLWGPYLWADGEKGRKSDTLVWKPEDLGPDGTHPSPSGRQKVAELLLNFFKNDPTAKIWFAEAEK